MNKIISIRVLQHEKGSDQIRIGAKTLIYASQLEKAARDLIAQYEKEKDRYGGFKAACEKYYQRIAIVDGDTLQELRVIYKNTL